MSIAAINTSFKPVSKQSAPLKILLTQADHIRSLDPSKVITGINFGSNPSNIDDFFNINLPCLGDNVQSEVWMAQHSLVSGSQGDIKFRKNNEILFGKICLDESNFESLSQCSNDAYSSIINFIIQNEFPHLLRIWNFFPYINKVSSSIERYQSFCLGRHQAFAKLPEFEHMLPAATAIGTHEGKFTVYFLASTKAGVQVENPRQTSAYHYPKQYGSKSPSFARATLKHWQDVSQFFISGTASVVGHETLHEGNVLNQMEETLKNIEALITSVRVIHQQPIRDLTGLSLMKVYIRYLEHYEIIKKAISQRVGNEMSVIYLQGDICRSNLLLEIEAIAEFEH